MKTIKNYQSSAIDNQPDNIFIKLIFPVISFLCVAGIITCIICNLAINKTISWSLYPIISILFFWITVTPALVLPKNRIISSMAILSISVFPFLFLLEKIIGGKEWFFALGVPVAIVSLIGIWLIMAAYKILKKNLWFLYSFAVFMLGVVVSSFIKYFIYKFDGVELFTLDFWINILASLAMTIVFAVIGNIRKSKKIVNY